MTSSHWRLLVFLGLIGLVLQGSVLAGPRSRARRARKCSAWQQCPVPWTTQQDTFCLTEFWFDYVDDAGQCHWIYWMLKNGECTTWYWTDFTTPQTNFENCNPSGTPNCSFLHSELGPRRRKPLKPFKSDIADADFVKIKPAVPQEIALAPNEIRIVVPEGVKVSPVSEVFKVQGQPMFVRLFTVTVPGVVEPYRVGYECADPGVKKQEVNLVRNVGGPGAKFMEVSSPDGGKSHRVLVVSQ